MRLILSMVMVLLAGTIIGAIGATLLIRNSRKVRAFIARRMNERETAAAAVQMRLASGPRFVTLGGGTGLSALLSGLKGYSRNITALVTVTDEGGSSGRLVRDWGMLPPGDIRNCLAALSENDDQLRAFLNFRFDRGDLKGHSLGNLILLAATEQTGDFKNAVELVNSLLAIRGKVLPITTENVTLVAQTADGRAIRGELAVAREGNEISGICLMPEGARMVSEAKTAIAQADMIILGPGSLFTSVIPNLLVDECAQALRDCGHPIVYVTNLMSQPGETGGLSQLDHVKWVAGALGRYPDAVIVSDDAIPEPLKVKYSAQGAEPLYISADDEKFLQEQNCRVFRASLLQVKDGAVVRHHSARLAEVLMRVHRKYDEAQTLL